MTMYVVVAVISDRLVVPMFWSDTEVSKKQCRSMLKKMRYDPAWHDLQDVRNTRWERLYDSKSEVKASLPKF